MTPPAFLNGNDIPADDNSRRTQEEDQIFQTEHSLRKIDKSSLHGNPANHGIQMRISVN